MSDGWITVGLCQNHPWVLYFGLKFPFLCLFGVLLYEAHEKAYEYNNDFRYKCGMIILFTTTTTITAVCVVVADNSLYFSDVTIGTTAGD